MLLGDEGSLQLNLTVAGRLREEMMLEASWTGFNGRSTSLYAYLPYRATFRLSIKAMF